MVWRKTISHKRLNHFLQLLSNMVSVKSRASRRAGQAHKGSETSWGPLLTGYVRQKRERGASQHNWVKPVPQEPKCPVSNVWGGTFPLQTGCPSTSPSQQWSDSRYFKQSQSSSAGEDCRGASVKDTAPVQGAALRRAPSGFILGSIFPLLQDLEAFVPPDGLLHLR